LTIDRLNNEFGIGEQLRFVEGEGGFIYINIQNKYAQAVISTFAGQVLSWHPFNEAHDVLFVSKKAFFESGKAIKGGIPICWPWFGSDPEAKGRGSHGFVRNRQWQVISTQADDNGSNTSVTMQANISDVPEDIWPYQSEVKIHIEVSDKLKVMLSTRNTGQQIIPLTQALHTYFRVNDISRVSVSGFDQLNYIDTIDENSQKTQSGDVNFDSEVDRIYTGVSSNLIIEDDSLNRKINIQTQGSKSAIIWNPWLEKSKAMPDFGQEEYRQMLCVETANVADDQVELKPGCLHQLSACYSLQ